VEIVYSALAGKTGIDFSVEKDGIAYDMVIGDRMRINQILTNLMPNAFSADVQKALEYGMDAHVSKPIDNELLIATLCRFRNGRTQS